MTDAAKLLTRRLFLSGLLSGAAASGAIAGAPLTSVRPTPKPADLARRTGAITERIVVRSGLSGKTCFAVGDASTGELLDIRSSLFAQPPASVAKAVTSLYALEQLGPGYRFHTRLIAGGPLRNGRLDGDLILQGGGDPLLDTDALGDLAASLKAAGVREVTGEFRIQATALPRINLIDPSQPDHVGYNPTVSALNLNYNRVYFEWKRNSSDYAVTMDARSERYRPQVSVARMRIVNRSLPVYTYASAEGRDEWTVARAALGNGGGRWLPVRQPAEYAAEVFQTLARSHGIVLRIGTPLLQPVSGTVLAEHSSPELRNILKGMLKYSTNLTAEAVGLTATRQTGASPQSLEDSGRAMSNWLETDLGARRPHFVDHSGLGDQSRVTAHDMFNVFVRSGPNGTLRGLLKPLPLRDSENAVMKNHPAKVVAKTGTLNFVSGLGGYIRTPSGRDLAFAIFSSDVPKRASLSKAERERPPGGKAWARRARRLQNDLIQAWARAHDA